LCGVRPDEQDTFGRRECAPIVARVQVDTLQVRQQAHEDVLATRGPQVARLQGNRAAVNAIEQLLRFVLEADLAALERIDQQLHGFPVVANQEVPGEVDTVQRQPEATADLEVEQAERERHAGATIEDVVQE